MKRRTLLQILVSSFGARTAGVPLGAQTTTLLRADDDRLRALADVVLPAELGEQGRARVVAAFLSWVADYQPDAETDYGYGFPRRRRTPPNPSTRYVLQLDDLDADARRHGRPFTETAAADRRAIVETAIAAAKIERLPARPDGGHVATDLMGFFFNSADANDLCYRARIGRDACRTLEGSRDRPAPLASGGR